MGARIRGPKGPRGGSEPVAAFIRGTQKTTFVYEVFSSADRRTVVVTRFSHQLAEKLRVFFVY